MDERAHFFSTMKKEKLSAARCQVGSVVGSVSMRDLADYAQVAPASVPPPRRAFDLAYGDPGEAVASAAAINGQMHRFCSQSTDGSPAYAGCPPSYSPRAVADALLGMYGLSGNVTLAVGLTSRRRVLASIPFCSLTPSAAARAAAAADPALCNSDAGSRASAQCFDASVLAAGFQCQWSYPFAVWSYGTERNVSVLPPPPKVRRRSLTPFNNVIGGIVLTQRRRRFTPCSGAAGAAAAPIASQFSCQQSGPGETPFGTDAAFQRSSGLYDGKLDPADFYAANEMRKVNRSGGGHPYPYAFFPHQWGLGGLKETRAISTEDYGLYKLYFDTRLSAAQAQRMVQYIKDAGFVDELTEQMDLEIVNYNAEFNAFGVLTVQFRWDMGGAILWDYQYNAAQLSLYSGMRGQLLIALEVTFAVMLLFDAIRESRDIRLAILRENVLHGYFLRLSNCIDWGHYILIVVSSALWGLYNVYISNVSLKLAYPILQDIKSRCRFFSTSSKEEFDFLEFSRNIKYLAYMKNLYSAMNCLVILLFVVRIIKILDFQTRMSLITRTLRLASTDLFHYMCLFSFIFVGYASVGTLLLGDRLPELQNLSNSFSALFKILMGWETMYRAMSKAAGKSQTNHTIIVFLLFYWSWVIIATFVMMNIILAIIVDAYTTIKGRMKTAPTIIQEFAGVCKESIHKLVSRALGTPLIHDSDLEKALLKYMREFQARKKLLDAVPQKYSKLKCLRLTGGLLVLDQDIMNILSEETAGPEIRSRLEKAMKKKEALKSVKSEEDGVEIVTDEWSAPVAIQNLIKRYSTAVTEGMDDIPLLECIQIENLQRAIASYALHDFLRMQLESAIELANGMARFTLHPEELDRLLTELLIKRSADGTIDMDVGELLSASERVTGELCITVVGAKRLPKLDIFGDSDPRCVLIVEDSSRPDSSEVLARTVPKMNEVNPVWNEQHTFTLSCGSDTTLIAAILDNDDLGEDDLIGAASIVLSDLPVGQEVDKWYYLRNDEYPNLVKKAMIRLRIRFSPNVQSELNASIPVTRKGSALSMQHPGAGEQPTRSRVNSLNSILRASSEGSRDINDQDCSNRLRGRSETIPKNEMERNLPRCASSPTNLNDGNGGNGNGEDNNMEISWLRRRLSSIVNERKIEASCAPTLLQVTLVSARHLPKTDIFQKSDPYVKLALCGAEHESEVRRNTYSPDWGQLFVFRLRDSSASELEGGLKLTLMDWNRITEDTFIGTAVIEPHTIERILQQHAGRMFEYTLLLENAGVGVIGHDLQRTEVTIAFRAVGPQRRSSAPRNLAPPPPDCSSDVAVLSDALPEVSSLHSNDEPVGPEQSACQEAPRDVRGDVGYVRDAVIFPAM